MVRWSVELYVPVPATSRETFNGVAYQQRATRCLAPERGSFPEQLLTQGFLGASGQEMGQLLPSLVRQLKREAAVDLNVASVR